MNTFTVVGVSRFNGEIKVRYAHDMTYVKGLSKGGNTDIELVEAPSEMDKPTITAWLKTTPLYENQEFREAIDARIEMYAAKTAPATVKETKVATTVKAKKEVKAKEATLATVKARAKKKVEKDEAEATVVTTADEPATA
jgi:hypothetical protein